MLFLRDSRADFSQRAGPHEGLYFAGTWKGGIEHKGQCLSGDGRLKTTCLGGFILGVHFYIFLELGHTWHISVYRNTKSNAMTVLSVPPPRQSRFFLYFIPLAHGVTGGYFFFFTLPLLPTLPYPSNTYVYIINNFFFFSRERGRDGRGETVRVPPSNQNLFFFFFFFLKKKIINKNK
jgi:hypothetical protein